jgi:hypothetical protein
MATRPVFVPRVQGTPYVLTHFIDFEWFPGMAVSQKQKSIRSLHNAAKQSLSVGQILEISSKSLDTLGVALSAFNLTIQTVRKERSFSVEAAYQGSKVFERGGPFVDLLSSSPRDAKRDPRLTNSGRLVGFRFFGQAWELQPPTAFYDWLYLNALRKRQDYARQLTAYSAFTDIEFNPDRSINCQAYSAALFRSLQARGELDSALESKETFVSSLERSTVTSTRALDVIQDRLEF